MGGRGKGGSGGGENGGERNDTSPDRRAASVVVGGIAVGALD